jgi:TMEM175 potassium channel family protein
VPAQDVVPARAGRLDRVVFFSDAVFAIVITLLILPIAVDVDIDETSGLSLGEVLRDLTPRLVAFVVSFLVIGQFWLAHLRNFDLISRIDRGLTSLNLLELMVISFLPFPTALLGARGADAGTVAFYAACLTAASALTLAAWLHAVRAGLLDPGADPVGVRANTARSMASVGVFALSVPVGLLGLGPALVCWVVVLPVARAVAARPRAVRVSAPRP